ncbi:MAG: hypothetical protein ACOH2V_01155 [Candidatus Saccharimonadaceae bacterium]
MSDEISVPITNYSKKAAELILGNLHRDEFKTGTDNISSIRKQGDGYFREKFEKIYNYKAEIKADFKIATPSSEPDVYIVFTSQERMPVIDKAKTLGVIVNSFDQDNYLVRTRVDITGNPLYILPINSVLGFTPEGDDILYIEAGKLTEISKDGKKARQFKQYDNINYTVGSLLKSFDSNIEGIIPIMNNT